MAKVLETVDELEKKGYSVQRDYRVDNFEFDIYATKNNEKDLYIEVKIDKYSNDAQKRVIAMLEYVKGLGNAKFELIVASPPLKKDIEVEGLNEIIGNYLIENMPESLRSLSYKTVIESICDLEINSIFVAANDMKISGTGGVEASFYADSYDREGIFDVFPCEFTIYLNNKFKIQRIGKFKVDTSAFHESDLE
jgi:hypothetical protein